MKHALPLFELLVRAARAGENTALVTVTETFGSSARAAGTQFAVTEAGETAGSLSGGCIEAAVVAEAQRVMAAGRAEILRFGAGSPFIDIRLPCGGGMDLLITPGLPRTLLERACRQLAARQPLTLSLGHTGGAAILQPAHRARRGTACHVTHWPDLRLILAGQGAETLALARLAAAADLTVLVLTPDDDLRHRLAAQGIAAQPLPPRGGLAAIEGDAFTAFVTLFHDHALELPFLAGALAQPHLMVGAMGSRATHARRCAALGAQGVAAERIAALLGPIGLIPASRDPQTLAISILAQIAARETAALTALAEREAPAALASAPRHRPIALTRTGGPRHARGHHPLSP